MNRDFDSVKEGLLTLAGAVIAVGLVAGIAYLGDFFGVKFLQSGNGLLVTTVFIIEFLFLTSVVVLAVKENL